MTTEMINGPNIFNQSPHHSHISDHHSHHHHHHNHNHNHHENNKNSQNVININNNNNKLMVPIFMLTNNGTTNSENDDVQMRESITINRTLTNFSNSNSDGDNSGPTIPVDSKSNSYSERASSSSSSIHHSFQWSNLRSSSSSTFMVSNNQSSNLQLNSSSSSTPTTPIIDNDISTSSPSILSPSSLSSLNTQALVRTISNGSTFGPIPNWPSNDSPSSSSYNSVNPFYKIFQIQSNHPGWKSSSSSTTSPNLSSPNPGSIISSPTLFSSSSSSSLSSSTLTLTNHCITNNQQSLIQQPSTPQPTILATTAPAQINISIKLNLPLIFGDNYVLTSQIEASNLYRCLGLNTAEEFCCKVVLSKNYYDFLAPHLRMDGHTGINQVKKIIIGRVHTFILFSPSFGDLHSYVRNKRRLREHEAMPLFRQIVEIVADCHRNGIILRDLKLRKFIFSNKERTKLKLETLEGASLFDDDDDTLTDKHGCPAYVSPEILLSNSFSGLAADCWGMGVILYTMLVGRYPFHDVNPSSVFCKIRRGTYYIPDHLSKHGKCLIRSLMRMDPDERLTADDTLAHRWFDSFRSSNLMNNSIMMKRNSTTSIATVPPVSSGVFSSQQLQNSYPQHQQHNHNILNNNNNNNYRQQNRYQNLSPPQSPMSMIMNSNNNSNNVQQPSTSSNQSSSLPSSSTSMTLLSSPSTSTISSIRALQQQTVAAHNNHHYLFASPPSSSLLPSCCAHHGSNSLLSSLSLSANFDQVVPDLKL
ncbi:tribbles pseudokinase 2 [Dermatophagoides pteronyssinus]|uniref:Spindle assembly checkpoint kinase-like n=1 Tax=Dermatophagoides pteronyssinus TaxID=6956 RepID=A0A6P6Y587_DERPT|nr:spindle assembly checkpoint kinase-like [Dermatophagoides pteronyssinus]